MIKLKAAEIDEMFAEVGDDVGGLMLSVHDELCLSIAEDHVDMAAQATGMMQDFSQGQLIEFSVPMTVDAHSGRNWAEASFPQRAMLAPDMTPYDDEFEDPEAALHG
jgi:DNA polymerase I-like protein with 3'-5' exonuclease and polymerase domains